MNAIIALKGRSDRQEHNNKYLWTQEQYGGFVLDLEVKTTPGTSSASQANIGPP